MYTIAEISEMNIAMKTCLKLSSPASILLTVSSSDIESADATSVSLTGPLLWALSNCKQKGYKERYLEPNINP
jgi:hypothetical protein